MKRECIGLLSDLRRFHPLPPGNVSYPDTYRLLVTPLLYSAWERCFTICNAVSWRRVRDECLTASSLNTGERAAWLMQANFYRGFTQKLLNTATPGEEEAKPKKSHFPALEEFIGKLDLWSSSPLDPTVGTDSLVMTFSNVNGDAVNLNAFALGISSYPPFQAIKFGLLHDLVGRRNEIGHGGILSPPPSDQFNNLWTYTETLIEDYCEAFKGWLVVRFPPPTPAPPPPTRLQRVLMAANEILKALTN